MKVRIRPSSLPAFFQCPSCIEPTDKDYRILKSEAKEELANVGSACHEYFKSYVFPNTKPEPTTLSELAEKYGVAIEGYNGLRRKTTVLANKFDIIRDSFTQAAKLEQTITSVCEPPEGTPDLYELHGEYAIIFDLKTGMLDYDHMPQMIGYCIILMHMYAGTGLEEFYCYVWNPVIESYNAKKFTIKEIQDYEKRIIERKELIGKEFRTGPFCGLCSRLETCPFIRRSMLELDENSLKCITVEKIMEVRPIIQAMKKFVENYDIAEKALLEKYGVIPLGDNHELCYLDATKNSYNVPLTLQILQDEFKAPMDTIGKFLKLESKAIEEIGKMIAEPRGKGAMIKKIKTTLNNMGACYQTTIRRRTVRKIDKLSN